MTTPTNRYERILVLLLRLDGIIMLTALIPSVKPGPRTSLYIFIDGP
jgi:hypothetical protein